MKADLNHVLLTRFNLPSGGVESLIRAHDGWLRSRVELFERYCLPSVRSQTDWDFHWIIYFDPESPQWFMDWIDSHRAEGIFIPRFRASVSPEELAADIRSLVYVPRSGLATTNLDNDDALAIDFAERVQAVGPLAERTALYLTHGLIRSPHGLYRRTDRTNAFCSVIESWDDPQTCWADWHNRLGLAMPVRELGGTAAWLQVVHGANVSNRVHGLLTSPSRYARLFPDLVDDVPEPTLLGLARDRLVTAPSRVLRDSTRAAAKKLILALGGKDGLNRVKALLASHGRSTRIDTRMPAEPARGEAP
jgi:hypothetical protein